MLGRNLIAGVLIGLLPAFASAAGGGAALEHANIQSGSEGSLQRGARTYMNYCMGCHSLSYMRYNRMAQDLNLPADIVEENLIFTANPDGSPHKVTDMMVSAMSEEYGKQVFGVAPPDLSLIARSRGVDWLYTYLKSFYVDPTRSGTGHNNTVFKGVGMPNVMWELQGLRTANFETVTDADGNPHDEFRGFETLSEGQLSGKEYDKLIRDLVNFLAYVAEPGKAQRHAMGVWVLLFLLVFIAAAYILKKEYWRDVR